MIAAKPRIAVFAGPTATIMNSAPLVTANEARRRHGLPVRTDRWGRPLVDVLRAQRLAAPVTVYVEQFSAHPLERHVAHLYAPPDGYLDAAGAFHPERTSPDDVPVFQITLRPEDGLVPLPYMARQADGTAWDADTAAPGAPSDMARQPFYPDASRIFEEVDRLGLDNSGFGNLLGSQADYDFYRALPSSGYPAGLPAAERTDSGDGDIPPEVIGRDYFPYRPPQYRREPTRANLAVLTNRVAAAMATGAYDGALWLEGSPSVEDTTYWLGLLIDTGVPIVGCNAPDLPHGTVGATGDRHLVDGVRYITSGVWRDEAGRDRVGAVLISAYQLFAARDVQKGDGRPGGFVATGGHGGIVGTTGEAGRPRLSYLPLTRATWRSDVRLSALPNEVAGIHGRDGCAERITVATRGGDGGLLPDAIPHVSFHKHARYARGATDTTPEEEVALLAQIEDNLRAHPLAGFIAEGTTPHGNTTASADATLRRATYLGMPVVRTGRGYTSGYVSPERVRNEIAGSNLTPTKARLLLMAAMLKLGALPTAADPDRPTPEEAEATRIAVAAYQAIFDSH